MKAKFYKNLVLSSSGVLFDLHTRKIFVLEDSWIEEFEKLINGKIKESESLFADYIKDNEEINNNMEILAVKINMTNFCNLKCKYCFANEGTYNKKKQSFSENLVENLVLFIKEFPTIKYITFFGGEPLLNYTTMKFICEELCKVNSNIKFLCQTNGTVLNKDIIELFKKYDFNVTLSVDGIKEDNDRNRIDKNGNGTFDTVRKNYDYIRPSIKSIEATYDKLSSLTKSETADYIYEEFKCKDIGVCDLFKEKNREVSVKEEVDNFIYKPYNLSNEITGAIINYFTNNKSTKFCSSGSHLIQIDSDGNLYPCHLLIDKKDKYCLGNINDFDKDYFNIKRGKFAENLLKEKYQKCKNCEASWTCSKCYAEKEEITHDDCKGRQDRILELFEELGKHVKEEELNLILNKIEENVIYV